MKKITLFLLLSLCTLFIASAQQERTATAKRSAQSSQSNTVSNRAPSTIYDTSHVSNQGAEITAAANGAATSMADAIVLAGTNRILKTVTVDVFNLASSAPYSLTLRIFSDCTSNGAGNSICGSGPGTLIAGSTVTQNVIPPAVLGTIHAVTFTLPDVDLSGQVDNTISVSLNASRNDIFWVIGENTAIGAQPAGEPPLSVVERCGSLLANNGCARSFGIQNNFAMTLVADSPPPSGPISICAAGNPRPIPATGTSGLMTPAVATVSETGILGIDYALDDVSLNLIHSWANDVEAVLISPSGTRVALSTDNGDSSSLDTAATLVFTDDSANNIGGWDVGVPLADYRAEGGGNTFPVGAGDGPGVDLNTLFDGESITGNWTLEINDDVGGDSGTLNSFCINFSQILGDPPVIVCPGDIITNNAIGNCSAVVNYSALAIDTEDGIITGDIVSTHPSGSTFPVGTTTVTLSVTDSDGNTSTCDFMVTVVDNEAPNAVCQNITVELDEDGMYVLDPTEIDNGSSDNCAIATYEFGTSGPAGSGSLQTIFVGTNGGSPGGAVYFDVTVGASDIALTGIDVNTTTAAGDPFNITVYAFEGTYVGNTGNPAPWGSPVATGSGVTAGTDIPSTATLSSSVTLQAGTTYAMAVVMDATHAHRYTNGNGSNQNFSNADVSMSLGAAGNVPFSGTAFSPRVFNGSLTYDIIPDAFDGTFDCSMVGANTIYLMITDVNGNSSTCEATVTVEDNTAPVITCIGEPATVTATVSDSPALPITDNSPAGVSTTITVADDFDITDLNVNLDITHTWVGDVIVTLQSPAGTTAVIVDRMGFTGTGFGCSSNDLLITLDDEAASAIEDECQPGPPAASGSFTPNNPLSAFDGQSTMGDWTLTVSDNAGGDTGTLNAWGIEYSYDVSATPLDVILDANGMASIDPLDLLLNVDEACGYTITVGGAGGGIMGSLSTLFASDNGGDPGGAVYFDVTVGPIDLQLTDIDVNTAEAGSFDLDIYTLVGTYVGNEANAAAWGSPAATASGTSAGIDSPSNAVLAAPITLTANTTYGMALVLDSTHAHSYTNGTGANQNYSNADLSIALGAASNIPFTAPTFAPRVFNGALHYVTGSGSGLDFTCADLGENQVEVTVTDDSGNESTCTATVNVIDNTAPVLVCQDTTIELGPDGTATVDPMALLASMPTTYEVMVIGSDNQTGSEGFTDFTVDVTEATTVTFDWDFTLNDTPGFDSFGYLLNGTYTQLTDPILGNQSGSGSVAVAPGDVFGFRAQTDDNVFGNTETVISNFMPGFEGQFEPANWNLTLTNSDGDAFFVEIPGGPLSFDACGITVLAVDVPTVSCADIGTPITITVFASDASGNLASCTSVVTVVDNLGPELTCPADQTVDPGQGNLFYIVPDYFATGEATADDNCTDPVTDTTQDPAPGTAIPDGTYTITMTATDEYGNTSTCDFELTVDTVVGVDENSLDAGLALYPNPASTVVNLVNKTNISLEKMMIYDINGKLVNQTDLRTMQGQKAVDVSSLASGVYMVQIIGDNASTVKRLIKE